MQKRTYIQALLLLSLVVVILLWWCLTPDEDEGLKSLRKYVLWKPGPPAPALRLQSKDDKINTQLLRDLVYHLTYDNLKIRNTEYGTIDKDTPIIVIQVHRDYERLQYLIISLAEVVNIQTVLLVFSHSYFDNGVNKLVESIDFCRVVQIFYQFSVQLYPDQFPGIDANDCLRKLKGRSNDSTESCSKRDARLTESKHHWWWKARHVFEGFVWSKHHVGMVLFLDETSYVSPDLLYMLNYAQLGFKYFSAVWLVALGDAGAGFEGAYDQMCLSPWRTACDVAVAFNSSAWRRFEKNKAYCMHDDCRWSHSLLKLMSEQPGGYVDVLVTAVPRVISTAAFPSGAEAWRVFRSHFAEARRRGALFPKHVHTAYQWAPRGRIANIERVSKGTQCWADKRDQLFCLYPNALYYYQHNEDVTFGSNRESKLNLSLDHFRRKRDKTVDFIDSDAK